MDLQVSHADEILPVCIGLAVIWQTAMQITELLQRVHVGDQQALHTVIPLVYDELKKLAAGHLWRAGTGPAAPAMGPAPAAVTRQPAPVDPPHDNRAQPLGNSSRRTRRGPR